jgi:single-stranded-DNA-specific exonuclease
MEPVVLRNWQLRSSLPSETELCGFARDLNVSDMVGRLLWLRGIQSIEAARKFLASRLADLPDPALLPDMERACERLVRALQGGEKIAVHGDYDVDGITGCSLLVEMLRAFGAEVVYHIPLRLVDGYGLSGDAIRDAHRQGCTVIVSVDCGVSAYQEAEVASMLGLDLIVTDHHQPPETLPRCYALINPHLTANRFPWPDLAGVGVAFFLILALRRSLRSAGYFSKHPEPDVRFVLDLVALGTIADIVPLNGVNRILVKQ